MLQADSFRKLCDRVVLGAAAWLLTFPVLAVGGVAYWSRALIELTAAGLLALWSIRVLLPHHSRARSPIRHTTLYCIVVLLVLISVPLLPLPPAAVRWLSPQAFHVYTTALPGWPDRSPFGEVFAAYGTAAPSSSFGALLSFPASWRPLSLVPYQSWMTLMMGGSYVVFGAVVALYPWRREVRALTVLMTAVVSVAVCEALYAFVQQSNGSDRLLWFACPPHATCTGTYLNRNHFAGLLEMALPLLVARAVLAWRARPREFITPPADDGWLRCVVHALAQLAEPAVGRAASLWCLALLVLAALAASGSRSAFVVTLLAFAVTLGGRRAAVTAQGRGAVLAALVFAAGLWLAFPQVRDRFGTGDIARVAIAADTSRMIRAFPLFGVGLGNFGSAFSLFRARTIESWAYGVDVDHAHDEYLEWVSEVGVLAAILTVVLLIGLARTLLAARGRDAPTSETVLLWGFATGATALLLHSFTDYNLHIPANALVFSFLVGGLVRLARHSAEPTTSAQERRSVSRPRAAVAVVLGLSLVWGITVRQRWSAEAMFRRVYPDSDLRSLMAPPEQPAAAAALAAVQQAAARLPRSPAVQLGLARQAGSSATVATAAFVRSLWGDPVQPRALLELTKTLAASPVIGSQDGSGLLSDLLDRAVVLGRYDPSLRLDVVDWYVQRWDTFPPNIQKHAVEVADAALAVTAGLPGSGSPRQRTLNAYERIVGTRQQANRQAVAPATFAAPIQR